MELPLVLRTAIGTHDHVRPLWEKTVSSDRIRLDLALIEPLPRVFRRMVRDLDFDLCEMALATEALAYRFEKPITALPIGLWRRFHHDNLLCAKDSKLTGPRDLAGGRIGVRAYSQTTGVWLRGILQHQYDLDLDAITWVTLEDAHVDEYRDPPNVMRAAPGKGLKDLLAAGDVDAVMGLRTYDPRDVRPLIPDAAGATAAWYRQTGVFPLNHVVVVRTELLDAHPWLAEEIISLFTKAKIKARENAPPPKDELGKMLGSDTHPYGREENRAAAQMLLNFCAEQHLTPRAYTVDEIFPA
jgi:4,5-dihydroxyphthalate decarboxylase